MHSPYPKSPKVLTHFSINSKSKISSKYHINYGIWWVRLKLWFNLRQNSSPAENMENQTSYMLPKCNGDISIGLIFPSKKAEIQKKKGTVDPKQVKNSEMKIPWNQKLENNLLCLGVLSYGPTYLLAPLFSQWGGSIMQASLDSNHTT